MTKRDLDAQETKKKILETAIKLFSEYGIETVTVDDITQHAGVSKGSFYTHFPSKDSVLVEQFNQIDAYYEKTFQEISPQTPASEQLRILIASMCHYCSNVCGVNVMKVVYMNQISLSDRQNILNKSDQRAVYVLLERIVEWGLRSGEFQVTLDREVLVEYLARFGRSLIYDWCLYDGKEDLETMGKEFFDLIIKWLTKPQ
ncbi:TetR/AcrR family transcriptional regulator [Brevibacillus sp. NRS-1366]|uniref:TetR/AcrR family transcriptional regulator n=1 Tax=Brevibacillus sp. NRS-1366 TaxID=3233899 RepID=UPI003D1DA927